jgi:hypothetical protein
VLVLAPHPHFRSTLVEAVDRVGVACRHLARVCGLQLGQRL